MSQVLPGFPKPVVGQRAVAAVKILLKKSMDPYLALLVCRTIPLKNGYSPSELLMCTLVGNSVLGFLSVEVFKQKEKLC